MGESDTGKMVCIVRGFAKGKEDCTSERRRKVFRFHYEWLAKITQMYALVFIFWHVERN